MVLFAGLAFGTATPGGSMTIDPRLLGSVLLSSPASSTSTPQRVGDVAGAAATAPVASTRSRDQGITRDLARSCAEYEAQMATLREQVNTLLDHLDVRARAQKPPDVARLSDLHAARETFCIRGEWPDLADADALLARAIQITERLHAAYRGAIARCESAELRDLRRTLAEEFQVRATELDLISWGSNLLHGRADETRTVTPDSSPMAIEAGLDTPYRLEIVGATSSPDARLLIHLPLADARVRVVTAVPEKLARATASESMPWTFRAVISVREEVTGAEIGVERPAGPVLPNAAHEGWLCVAAAGAPIRLESVCVKPIVAGVLRRRAEEAPAHAKVAPPAPREPAAALERGSVWDGQMISRGRRHDIIGARVESRTGNEFVLISPRPIGSGQHVRRFRIERGGRLALQGLHARGGPATVFNLLGGAGRIAGDTLTFQEKGNWRANGDVGPFVNSVTLRRRR